MALPPPLRRRQPAATAAACASSIRPGPGYRMLVQPILSCEGCRAPGVAQLLVAAFNKVLPYFSKQRRTAAWTALPSCLPEPQLTGPTAGNRAGYCKLLGDNTSYKGCTSTASHRVLLQLYTGGISADGQHSTACGLLIPSWPSWPCCCWPPSFLAAPSTCIECTKPRREMATEPHLAGCCKAGREPGPLDRHTRSLHCHCSNHPSALPPHM